MRSRPISYSVALICLVCSPSQPRVRAEETTEFGPFGTIHPYQKTEKLSGVVLFVSGDGGWNLGVIDMANALASQGMLVVGIDIRHYLNELGRSKEKCVYPAADFEELSHFVQKKKALNEYLLPLLVGYSSGATLVYATLAQSPPNTFRGAISMGFCPNLSINKPFCRGSGLQSEKIPHRDDLTFLPSKNMPAPWIAFQGLIDQVCDAIAVEGYVRQVDNAEIVLLPKVGHGFSVQRNWMPQFKEAVKKIQAIGKLAESSASGDVAGLPLITLSVKNSTSPILAVIVSGDGGWASLDRQVGHTLMEEGIPVVGLNSLRYFWKSKTPDQMGEDLGRILRYYMAKWGKNRAVVIGYSRGACVAPFMVSRLPKDLREKIKIMALLGPDITTDFEIELKDYWSNPKSKYEVLPEVKKCQPLKTLCFYGTEEKNSLCHDLDPSVAQSIVFPGGHHFGGDYERIARIIIEEAGQ